MGQQCVCSVCGAMKGKSEMEMREILKSNNVLEWRKNREFYVGLIENEYVKHKK